VNSLHGRPRLAIVGGTREDTPNVVGQLVARCTVLPPDAAGMGCEARVAGDVDGVLLLAVATVPLEGCATATLAELQDRPAAHRFLSLIFGLARLRGVMATRSRVELMEFHASYKYLLLAYSEREMRVLGRLAATAADRPWEETAALYRASFLKAFSTTPDAGCWVNALEHSYGHLTDHLPAADRQQFAAILHHVLAGTGSVESALDLLRHWAGRYDVPYIGRQALLNPFPGLLSTCF
jgi:uncharacterized protein YbgA (DUF1722 family)